MNWNKNRPFTCLNRNYIKSSGRKKSMTSGITNWRPIPNLLLAMENDACPESLMVAEMVEKLLMQDCRTPKVIIKSMYCQASAISIRARVCSKIIVLKFSKKLLAVFSIQNVFVIFTLISTFYLFRNRYWGRWQSFPR
jgi:hypothetical protein